MTARPFRHTLELILPDDPELESAPELGRSNRELPNVAASLSIVGSPLWLSTDCDQPFFRGRPGAWLRAYQWLCATAAPINHVVTVGGRQVELSPGQLCVSVRWLASRAGMSKSAAGRCLDAMAHAGLIMRDTSKVSRTGTLLAGQAGLITILNWPLDQSDKGRVGAGCGTLLRAGQVTSSRTRTRTKKKKDASQAETARAGEASEAGPVSPHQSEQMRVNRRWADLMVQKAYGIVSEADHTYLLETYSGEMVERWAWSRKGMPSRFKAILERINLRVKARPGAVDGRFANKREAAGAPEGVPDDLFDFGGDPRRRAVIDEPAEVDKRG